MPINFIVEEVIKAIFTVVMILFLLLITSCISPHDKDETEIMFTVCIDGIKNLSVINGLDCYYHPIEIDGQLVRCK